jgi:outer membrane protein assembly factor BamD (BamD/ComL family)
MKSILYRFSLKSASVVLACLAASLVLYAGAQQPANNEEFARRQYDSGMSFLQNHRYAEALKDLQAVVDSFGTSTVAPGALLQIAQYQLEVARDVAATQTAIDRLLKDYAKRFGADGPRRLRAPGDDEGTHAGRRRRGAGELRARPAPLPGH